MATTSNSANFVMNVPELVSMVFEYFDNREDVFKASLINKACREAALPILYRDIEITEEQISFSYDSKHRDIFERLVAAWLPLDARLPSILANARHVRHLAVSGCAPEVAMQVVAATISLDQLRIDIRGRTANGRRDEPFSTPTGFLARLPATLDLLHLDLSWDLQGVHFGIPEIHPLLEAVTSPPRITQLTVRFDCLETAVLAVEKLGAFAEIATLLQEGPGTRETSLWQRLFSGLPRLRELEGFVDINADQLLPVLQLLPAALEILAVSPTEFDACWGIFEALADPSFLPNLREMPLVELGIVANGSEPVLTRHITPHQARQTISRAIKGLKARKHCGKVSGRIREWYGFVEIFAGLELDNAEAGPE